MAAQALSIRVSSGEWETWLNCRAFAWFLGSPGFNPQYHHHHQKKNLLKQSFPLMTGLTQEVVHNFLTLKEKTFSINSLNTGYFDTGILRKGKCLAYKF